MASANLNVAIIGAGLSGLTLALVLYQQSIPCTVYESRPAPLNIGGAVMLSPNALKVLDALGLYQTLKSKGYNFEKLDYQDVDGNLQEVQEFGSEAKYGYQGLRIYRRVLIDELLARLSELHIPTRYGVKFSHIVSETDDAVTFAFTNGTTSTASILVGADGIHSTVRRYLYPNLETKFIGMAGVTAAVPTAQLKKPEGYHLPVTITSSSGAFVIAPQDIDGSEVLIGKQRRMEDQDRAGWEKTFADKQAAITFLQEGNEQFPEIVQNAASHISPNKINIWPFYVVPKLERWASEKRRVILLGDAAHAIPPSAGQGINQAFEDVYMFALLLGQSGKVKMQDALTFWQSYRQERVDKILELNKQIDSRRMPSSDEKAHAVVKESFDLRWLYEPNFKQEVDDWLSKQ